MLKNENKKFNQRVFWFSLLFLLVYEYLIVNKGRVLQLSDICYPFLAVDFSMGFCTKILPGAIYHSLVGIYTPLATNIYINIVYILFFVIVSFVVEFIYSKAADACKNEVLFLFFLCLIGSFSISTFVREPGMLDFYWLFFFFLSVLSLRNRYTKFLIPAFSFLMVLVHVGSVITYVFLILVIVGFLWFSADEKKLKKEYALVFVLTAFVSIATALYFLEFEQNNLVYSFDSFEKMLKNRGVDYIHYYQTSLYQDRSAVSGRVDEFPEFFASLPPLIRQVVQLIWSTLFIRKWKIKQLFIIPEIVLFLSMFFKAVQSFYKTLQQKLYKLGAIFLFIWAFPIMMSGVFFSTDITRWLSHAVIYMGCVCICICLRQKNKYIETIGEKIKPYFSIVLLIIVVYSMIPIDPIT